MQNALACLVLVGLGLVPLWPAVVAWARVLGQWWLLARDPNIRRLDRPGAARRWGR